MNGVCLDALNPAGCPTVEELQVAHVRLARLVAFDSDAFFSYAWRLIDAGIAVDVVLARESFSTPDYAGVASYYAERIAPHRWILGNEPDGFLLGESPSSWSMTTTEYADFWYLTARGIMTVQPMHAPLVVAGLVSGQPSYFEELLPQLDPTPWGVDIHPYGKAEPEAEQLFALYRSAVLGDAQHRFELYREIFERYTGEDAQRRLLCLEWNRAAHDIPAYQAMLHQETGGSAWFCWSSGMVEGFGLLDTAGNPTAEYYAYQEANRPMSAIDDRAAQIGTETLGEPLGPEVELSAGVHMRPYYNAILVEIPNAGVYALAEATVAAKFR